MIFQQFKIYTFYFYFLLFNLLDDLVGFLISVMLISIFSNVNFNFFVCLEMRVAGGGRSTVGIKTGEEDSRTESVSDTGSEAGLGDLDLF